MKFRQHRGSLIESLETTEEFKTVKALLLYLQKELNINVEKLKCKYLGYDNRCNWNTYLLYEKGFGVIGMTDTNLESEGE